MEDSILWSVIFKSLSFSLLHVLAKKKLQVIAETMIPRPIQTAWATCEYIIIVAKEI